MEREWITIREAAEIMGLAGTTVREKVRKRELVGVPCRMVPREERVDHAQTYVRLEDIEKASLLIRRRRVDWPDGNTPSAEDCIYLAGLFDGEGSVILSKLISKRSGAVSYTIGCSLPNTYHDAVVWVQETFGGSLQKRRRREMGWRDCWVWCTWSTGAYRTLQRIAPFLRIKHRQARLAIEFYERTLTFDGNKWRRLTPDELAWREACYLEMRRLNSGSP